MPDPIAERRREQQRLLETARSYVGGLSRRLPLEAAAVVGSVARGDFNVWSDIDVVVVADGLPARLLDRLDVLLADAPPGVQPVGFSKAEFREALRRGNPLVREAVELGVPLAGEDVLARLGESRGA